jgi:hypothetical protein
MGFIKGEFLFDLQVKKKRSKEVDLFFVGNEPNKYGIFLSFTK